jgi:hypothetical protein
MGYPYPLPKKISLRFCTNPRSYPGGKWGGGGGFKPPRGLATVYSVEKLQLVIILT